ncbi:hypothetical protein [Methylorubrum populi]
MRHTKTALIAGLLLNSDWAFAEENICVDLATTIGKNYSNYLSVDQQKVVQKADLCSENYEFASSAKRAQLEASYKVFSGSASASGDEVRNSQSRECDKKFGDFWRNQITSTEGRNVSAEGASVISQCLALTNDALNPILTMAEKGREVTFSVQYKPNVSGDIKINMFGPSDLEYNKCVVTSPAGVKDVKKLDDVAQSLAPTQGISMNCKRDARTREINGVKYKCTDESIFTIATSGPVKSIKIPRICDETIMPSRADDLQSQLDKLKKSIVGFEAETCPDGWEAYEPAYGRFLRGINPSGSPVDPDGRRAAGSHQDDAIASHAHSVGTSGADSFSMAPGGATQRLAHFKPPADAFSGGPAKETGATGSSETRPKNVAVLFCRLK